MLGFGSLRPAIVPATGPLVPHIRWLIPRDMPAVLVIENASQRMPWDEETFKSCLRVQNTIGMVATIGEERIGGYFLYRFHPDHIQLMTMAVDPRLRRRGIGSAIVTRLRGKLSSRFRTRITLECRETDQDALLFFRAQGFRATGVLREHFADTGEDAYRLEYQHTGQECECCGEPI